MRTKFLKAQAFLLEKWIPNALFLFVLSFYLLPSSKAVNNFFYIALLAPALLCINKLKWSESFKTINFKALFALAIFASISLIWSAEDSKYFKEFTYIVYVVIFCQLIYFTLKEKSSDFLLKRTKILIIASSLCTLYFTVISRNAHGGRLIFPTRMDHPIQLASVTALTALSCISFIAALSCKKEKFLFSVLFIINLFATIQTGSRGPLLALIVASLLLLIYHYRLKALIPISLIGLISLVFVYYSLSGNELQLSRLSKEAQNLNFSFSSKKELESVAVRLGIDGLGQVSFDHIKLTQGNETLLEDNFDKKEQTLPKDWSINNDAGIVTITPGNFIEINNNTGKSLNFYHNGITLEKPLKEITVKCSGKLTEALKKGLIYIQLSYRDKDKKYKSINNLSKFDPATLENQTINSTYTFEKPITWLRPHIVITGGKTGFLLSDLSLKSGNEEIFKLSTDATYDKLGSTWSAYSTQELAEIDTGRYKISNADSDARSFIQSNRIKTNALLPLTLSFTASVQNSHFSSSFLGALLILKYKDGTRETLNEALWVTRFFRDPGNDGRLIVWKAALNQSIKKPILGHGIGSKFTLKSKYELFLHAHNLWISTFYKLGIIGLILSFAIFFTKKFNLFTIILIYSCICAFFDTPDLFCSTRESWIYLLIPLVTSITYKSSK